MTVCIAVCLSDGAFLMADGREVLPFAGEQRIRDDAVKVHKVGDRVLIAHFGLIQPAPLVINSLNKKLLDNATTTDEILSEFQRATYFGLGPFLSRLSITKKQAEKLRFGFLFGGLYAECKPFIGGFLWRGDGEPSQLVQSVPGYVTTLGGDEAETRHIFTERLSAITNYGSTPSVDSCINAGIHTIRTVQRNHPSVGGTIRYSILRRGFSVSNGVVE